MRKSRLVMAVFMAMIGCVAAKAQQTVLSLNSSNKAIHWEIKPQADVKAGGLEISKPGYKMGDYVEGVVPGVVFTAYVNAGKEKNPDYSDNIYWTKQNIIVRSGIVRSLSSPQSCRQDSTFGSILTIPTVSPTFISTAIRFPALRIRRKMSAATCFVLSSTLRSM